ncbi:hypothetical protein EII11_10320 [Schaalia canis]|uniref:Uncharacterized protein n=2 Tax=Schaalia canis TaxID=100469 RepID=A0A3P1SBI6_9ACTO|nr:hypothetical protein EII11_10320 [Schaalia canis]
MYAIFAALYDAGHITRGDLDRLAEGNSLSSSDVDVWLETSFPGGEGMPKDKRDSLGFVVKDLSVFKGDLATFETAYKLGFLDLEK